MCVNMSLEKQFWKFMCTGLPYVSTSNMIDSLSAHQIWNQRDYAAVNTKTVRLQVLLQKISSSSSQDFRTSVGAFSAGTAS